MKSNKHAGQFKLRGKKTAHLTCGCCTIENWKDDCRRKEELLEVGRWMDEDKGYEESTLEKYEEFNRKRNYTYGVK